MNDSNPSYGEPHPDESFSSFYPDIIPAEEGHPTSAQFEVVLTDGEQGRGMRSKVHFRTGERLAKLSGILVSHTSLDTIQLTPRLLFSDPWFCRFLLHSCDPNAMIDTDSMEARAIKDIRQGDFVTIDYSATDDKVTRQFPCQCGSKNCRRWIVGRKEEPNQEGRDYLARHAARQSI